MVQSFLFHSARRWQLLELPKYEMFSSSEVLKIPACQRGKRTCALQRPLLSSGTGPGHEVEAFISGAGRIRPTPAFIFIMGSPVPVGPGWVDAPHLALSNRSIQSCSFADKYGFLLLMFLDLHKVVILILKHYSSIVCSLKIHQKDYPITFKYISKGTEQSDVCSESIRSHQAY